MTVSSGGGVSKLRRISVIILAFVGSTFLCEIHGFAPTGRPYGPSTNQLPKIPGAVVAKADVAPWHHRCLPVQFLLASKTSLPENDEQPSRALNPLYFIPWVGFFAYAFLFSPGDVMDTTDMAIIGSFLADPANAAGAINPLYFVVFNALGIMPLVLASLVLPQGSKGGLWAAPFLVGSAAAGYGALGVYLSFRAPPVVVAKERAETSWVTRNVFENKLFSWSVVALTASLLFTSGILSADLEGTVAGYVQLASTSKLVAVSSLDLAVLTACAATLIPRDYLLRDAAPSSSSAASAEDERKGVIARANLLAASTLLLPLLGAALYCALRPPLPEDE